MSKKQNQHRSGQNEPMVKTTEVAEEVAVQNAEPTEKKKKEKKERSSLGVRIAKYATAVVVVLVLFWFGCTTVVKEGNCAVILRFGAVREEITEAGLYLKLPWPFENAVSYDSRLQTMEAKRLETITKDKRNIVIQSYVVWEIDDPVLYHNSVGARGSATSYINDQVFSATNSTMGAYNLSALVSLHENEIKIGTIEQEIFTRVHDNCLANYGINVVDVSIERLSLPDANLESVFTQMRTDRENEIEKILKTAEAEADRIQTDAEAGATEIENEGKTEAAKLKAEMVEEVTRIHNEAQSKNVDLYQFLMELDATVTSINDKTMLIVNADQYPFNILFKYPEIANPDTMIYDLSYILTQLSEEDRALVIEGLMQLVDEYSQQVNTPPASGS